MAILYLGVSNTPKEVKNFYIGIDNKPKKVLKAYIGINNQAKLFYSSSPSFLEIDLDYVNWISNIQFLPSIAKYDKYIDNYKKYASYYDYVEEDEDYYYETRTIYVNSKTDKVYFNKNCNELFAPISSYHGEYIDLNEEVFSKISFDKTEEIADFMSQLSYSGSFNIDVLKDFNNVINMQSAFENCVDFYGNPIYAPNAINMYKSYSQCAYISGTAQIGEKVTNAAEAYCYAATGGKKSLNLKYTNVGKYGQINLYNCFSGSNIYGNINIYNTSSNLLYIFRNRKSTKELRIHFPSSFQIKSYATKICNSSEKHTYITSETPKYLDIQNSGGISYNIKIYNDIIE